MKTYSALQMTAAATMVLMCASCASTKMNSWTDPDSFNRPMGKTMVVGISESETLRRQYEEHFAAALTEVGIEAVTSISIVPTDKQMSKERMATVLTENAIHSVIVTRVLEEKDKVRYEAPMVYPSYYGGYYGFYNHSYSMVHSTGFTMNYVETHLETNLYDAKTEKLVWSGQKKVTSETSEKKNVKNVIKAIVKNLEKQGMIADAAPAN